MQTEAAKAAVKEVLEIEAQAKAFGAALAAVQNSYVAGARTTDFEQAVEQHAGRLLPSLRYLIPAPTLTRSIDKVPRPVE